MQQSLKKRLNVYKLEKRVYKLEKNVYLREIDVLNGMENVCKLDEELPPFTPLFSLWKS